jgi:hypothetical protein
MTGPQVESDGQSALLLQGIVQPLVPKPCKHSWPLQEELE